MGSSSHSQFSLIDAIQAPAIVVSTHGRIVFANGASRKNTTLFDGEPVDRTLDAVLTYPGVGSHLSRYLSERVTAADFVADRLIVSSECGGSFEVSSLSGIVPADGESQQQLLLVLQPVNRATVQWRSEELLEATAQMAKVGGWELDARTGEVTWTKETFRIHELPADGTPPLEDALRFFHPDDRTTLSTAISKAFAFGQPYDLQLRLTTAKGNARYTRSICTPIVENGRTIRLRGTFQDITERRVAEEQLKAERLRLAEVLAGTRVGDWQWYVATGRLTFGERWEAILGYPPTEAPSFDEDTWMALYHPDSIEDARRLLRECFSGKRDHYEHEVQMKHRNGSWIWVFDRGKVVERDPDGRPLLISGIHQDITSRKETEQRLRESETRYRDIFENSSAVKLLIDPDTGRIVEANSAASRFYGYTSDELSRLHIWDINTLNESGVRERLRQARAGENATFEFQHRKASGEVRDVQISTGPVQVGEQQLLHTIVFDVTDRKHAEEELQRLAHLESLGTLAGGIAHDFNNVLTGIFGHVSLARTVLPENNPAAEFLAEAEHSMERAKRLTQQLLTFSKGGAPIMEVVNLAPMIREVTAFDLSGSNVEIALQVPEDLWNVSGDVGQLQQVFSNLAINARQAMSTGGKLSISLQNVELSDGQHPHLKSGRYVKIEFHDGGTGIPTDILDRIFAPYFTTKSQGHGLGLATCHSIVDRHNGHIGVTSKMGEGTTFTVHLPAAKKVAAEKTSTQLKPQLKERPPRVLVMDDEPTVRTVTTQMLEGMGCEVRTVCNADQAITAYWESLRNEAPFDVVIMDLTIPGSMGGKEAVQHILLLNPDACVLCASGYAEDPVMADCKAYGFKGSLPKPFSLEQLQEVTNMWGRSSGPDSDQIKN
ncbi:PAS domain-containing hybrid sensor histidine kinase/response regulator [Fuerstiella marisgermanici]|uniref:histidine kinase n=1 Tax=Fuerstiella marisgermanici TaxID=1891926 RepID=A0A1P8WCS9_9PLAN|nr:PAS domain-containing sensor histidine kinase [Fuerstiella marisgermanici]APZ91862.1 Blue-light-activated protein [Fuerstiella marisgermanici]